MALCNTPRGLFLPSKVHAFSIIFRGIYVMFPSERGMGLEPHWEVLPHCDNEQLLECLATHIHYGRKADELDNKLWSWYEKTKDIKWLKYLIKRNDVNALKECLNLCRESLEKPDSKQRCIDSELTDSIRTLYGRMFRFCYWATDGCK